MKKAGILALASVMMLSVILTAGCSKKEKEEEAATSSVVEKIPVEEAAPIEEPEEAEEETEEADSGEAKEVPEGMYLSELTGEPIDESELPNLWQSFYRADKSRSRSQGRFGLGLSICKAILELHRAPYGVINRENGVTFWFEIPKAPDDSETE